VPRRCRADERLPIDGQPTRRLGKDREPVADADAVVERAVAAGARSTMPVADTFWGDRLGCLKDPFGHRWSVATHVRDVSREEHGQVIGCRADAGTHHERWRSR